MILLREVLERDTEQLERLSRIAAERHPGFLNIPQDQDQWREKIRTSSASFSGAITDKKVAKYIFVAEHLTQKRIVGISMVSAQHGTPDIPHFYFEVGSEQKYSATINTGFIHGTLRFGHDTDGPTEIGGLLVDPEFRNTEEKVGRQVSFVRFLYMGIHKSQFKAEVLAELLPPLTKKGKSPLWEAVGRRFTNMDYFEADALSSKNKEFIFSLFPTEKIYVTFLPAEARNAIGKVSKETDPVLHMLKKIGFHYHNHVDPFDGGPHVTAPLENITLIRKIKKLKYDGEFSPGTQPTEYGIVAPGHPAKFAAVSTGVIPDQEKIRFPASMADVLGIKPNDPVHYMPYY